MLPGAGSTSPLVQLRIGPRDQLVSSGVSLCFDHYGREPLPYTIPSDGRPRTRPSGEDGSSCFPWSCAAFRGDIVANAPRPRNNPTGKILVTILGGKRLHMPEHII